MAKIPKQLSNKVAQVYSVKDNAFRLDKIKNAELDKYKNEPKDEINVVVGDDKQPDLFLPQVKLCRWTNETNFSVRLKDTDYKQAVVETKDDKIKWSKGNIDIEFYDFVEDEGGYKLVWYLKEKPTTNKVEFTIQSKGLDFFYQPKLTPEEIAKGAFRPENVVGSYAVYHSTKGRMNDANGKDYKTGKAFHIYRPHIIDALGAETWGILHIENGIYSVEIPQEFLDNAVYPVKSNDTFGYTSAGASAEDIASENSYSVRIGNPYTVLSGGTLSKLSVYASDDFGYSNTTCNVKGFVNQKNSGGVSVHGQIAVGSATFPDFPEEEPGWTDITLGSEAITASTAYILNVIGDPDSLASGTYYVLHFDTASIDTYFSTYEDSPNWGYDTPDSPWTSVANSSDLNRKRSIYATYTPSGGGTAVKDFISSGFIPFAR